MMYGKFTLTSLLRLTIVWALSLTTALAFAQAADAPLKKVRIAVGTRVININFPFLTMPEALGYWKTEGYDVEVVPLGGGSLEAIQQLAAGNVDFAQVNSAPFVQADANNKMTLRAAMLTTINDWSLVSLEDGPIKNVKDFKGKSIGVPALSTGGLPLLKEYLRANGLDPEVDVSIVAVGYGAPAFEAIRSNKVQGLTFFQSALTTFENVGAKFKYFSVPEWRQMPDFALVTTQQRINADPKMVEGIVRGAVKGIVFALANPDCARRVQWKTWPDTIPSGNADKTVSAAWDLKMLAAQSDSMRAAFALGGGKYWGMYSPAMLDTLQSFLLRADLVKQKLPSENLLIGSPKFFERVNNFDFAVVKAQAETCQGF